MNFQPPDPPEAPDEPNDYDLGFDAGYKRGFTEGEIHAMERNAEAIDNLYDIVHARPLSVWERILLPLRRAR